MEDLLVRLVERLLAGRGDWQLWLTLVGAGAVWVGIRLLLKAKGFRVVIEYIAHDK